MKQGRDVIIDNTCKLEGCPKPQAGRHIARCVVHARIYRNIKRLESALMARCVYPGCGNIAGEYEVLCGAHRTESPQLVLFEEFAREQLTLGGYNG